MPPIGLIPNLVPALLIVTFELFSGDDAATLISMPNSDGVAIIEFGLVSAAK
jgi:hypothetical protein